MNKEIKLSETEEKLLTAMAEHTSEDERYMPFKGLAGISGLPLKKIRRTVRALARKGLTRYEKGLWSDDGEPAGAGYACTEKGSEWIWRLESRKKELEKNNSQKLI